MDHWNNCLRDGFTIHEEDYGRGGMEYTIIGPINDITKTSVEKFIISDDDYGVENIGKPIIGSILVTFNQLDSDLYICYLETNPEYQGNGVGTFLLRYVAVIANKMSPPIKTIHLNDMTDNAKDQANNIYIKLGLVAETHMDEPERRGLVVNAQDQAGWRQFCSHYLKNRENSVFINKKMCPCD